MLNLKNKLLKGRGSAAVETAIVFPLILVFMLLFAYVIKAAQLRAVVKNTAVKKTVEKRVGVANIGDCKLDSSYLGMGKIDTKAEYSEGKTSLGGSELEVISSAGINFTLPFFRKREIACKTRLLVAFYDYDIGMDGKKDSVWSLPVFERGRKIEEAFGGNMPDKFKDIDIYTNDGCGTKIISVDISKKTYQSSGEFYKAIERAVDDIASFDGDEEEGIIIRKGDIKRKRVLVVIPEEIISQEQRNQFDKAVLYGKNKDVEVILSEYQKIVEEKGDKKTDGQEGEK